MKKLFILSVLFIMISTFAFAGVEDRTTGKSGVTTNIADNTSRLITPSKLRTELNDLWDSSVLQGELETLVDPFIDAAIDAIPGGGSADEYLYTPTDGTCTTDMSAEFEAFLVAHDGIIVQKAGTCIRLDAVGNGTASASGDFSVTNTTDLIWRCEIEGQCKAGNTSGRYFSAIRWIVSDEVAFDSKTIVSSVVNSPSTAINLDDSLPYVVVASTAGYAVGDLAKITDSVPLPNRIASVSTSGDDGHTISNVAWDGTKCIVTTTSAHNYSDTRFIGIRDVAGTAAGSIDYIDGSDGYGRVYNITSLTPTTFSLQSMDNTTGSTAGTNIDCSAGGTYTSGGRTFRTATWAGEDVKIAGVDSVLNRIYFAHRLGLSPLYVQQPVLYRYTQARKVDIRGIEFNAVGDTSDLTIERSESAIDVTGVPRVILENIKCKDAWDACVILHSAPYSNLRNIRGNLLYNRGTLDPSTSAKVISDISVASEAVFTSNSHGFSDNNAVILTDMPAGYGAFEGVGCVVSNKTTNDFKCKDTYGNYFNTIGFPAWSGSAAAGEASNVTGLGYLAAIRDGGLGTTIDGIYGEEGRHLVTTDGAGITWNAVLSDTNVSIGNMGIPTYNLYQNGRCSASNGICLDEHEESYKATFRNMLCDSAMRGVFFGTYNGGCGQFRGDGTILDNILVIGGEKGLRFPPSDWFRDRQFTIGSINCQNMNSLQTTLKNTDHCVDVGSSESGSYSSYTNSIKVDIGTMTTTGVSLPLWVDKRATVNVGTINSSDYDDMIECGAGASVNVNTVVSSHANPKTATSTWVHKVDWAVDGFNMAKMRSDGTYNGCSVSFGNVTNTQGSGSNYLQDIFEQSDTTATKYYYLGQYTEHNPNSVTAARVLESGATTLSELTTSSTVFVSNPTVNATDSAYAYFSAKSPDSSATLVLQGAGGSSDGVEINPNKNGGTSEFRVQSNLLRFTPEDSTSTSARIQFTPFADTAIATGEAQFGKFGTGVTVTHDAGSYTSQREWLFYPRAHNYLGASTITNFATVYIDDAPTAGTNATATNAPYAIWSNDGLNRFDDGLVAKYPLATLNTSGTASTPALATETNYTYINTGSTTKANITLPSASVTDGVSNYKACVIDADGIRITAQSGDFIYNGSSASTSGGYIESTTIGSCIELIIIDTTNWMAISSTGTWVLG